jgi:hypothetical protein
MRFLSLLVAFCFSLNVMASTGTVQELERVLDDYHYSLVVEWDQKDQSFYDAKTTALFSQLEKLIKEEGLTQAQMMTVIEKKSGNKKMIEALKLKMSIMGKGVTALELSQIVKDSSHDMYSQGASWNGEVVFYVSIGLLVAAVVGYSIWWENNHVCVAYENEYVCNTYNNCSYSSGYYDPYFGGYRGNNFCYGAPYTTCGYANVCTEYQKK